MVPVETIRILRRAAERDEVVLRRRLGCEVAAVKVARRRRGWTERSGGDREDQRQHASEQPAAVAAARAAPDGHRRIRRVVRD